MQFKLTTTLITFSFFALFAAHIAVAVPAPAPCPECDAPDSLPLPVSLPFSLPIVGSPAPEAGPQPAPAPASAPGSASGPPPAPVPAPAAPAGAPAPAPAPAPYPVSNSTSTQVYTGGTNNCNSGVLHCCTATYDPSDDVANNLCNLIGITPDLSGKVGLGCTALGAVVSGKNQWYVVLCLCCFDDSEPCFQYFADSLLQQCLPGRPHQYGLQLYRACLTCGVGQHHD